MKRFSTFYNAVKNDKIAPLPLHNRYTQKPLRFICAEVL